MRYADSFCTYTEEQGPDGHFYVFSGKCKKLGTPYSVRVPGEALYKYRQGASIQEAMPMVSREDREFLMSGFTPEAWNMMFPPDPEEEDLPEGDEDLAENAENDPEEEL